MIEIKTFELHIDTRFIFSKALNARLGSAVFVAGYRDRMRRGLGVDAAGNRVRHKPLQENRRRRRGAVPLFDTGSMARSFRVNRGRTRDRLLVLDFPVRERGKARRHQLGGRGIPARPHIGASRQDLKNAARFLENHWRRNRDKIIKIRN